ncbi:unnamed protein product [Bursaphelenchus okinawaensis]|uniref:Uncharacterized protein n=1 Tax=Bursaphelenchus okinawaensis TaxID=465554 RepID=A0A811LT29_9BILA|nr:unnamed protein product [Bursaphelenchus okinawaensis]CAG9128047.1 unnamed protein product [Bursaphelenchus okinawaensis]
MYVPVLASKKDEANCQATKAFIDTGFGLNLISHSLATKLELPVANQRSLQMKTLIGSFSTSAFDTNVTLSPEAVKRKNQFIKLPVTAIEDKYFKELNIDVQDPQIGVIIGCQSICDIELKCTELSRSCVFGKIKVTGQKVNFVKNPNIHHVTELRRQRRPRKVNPEAARRKKPVQNFNEPSFQKRRAKFRADKIGNRPTATQRSRPTFNLKNNHGQGDTEAARRKKPVQTYDEPSFQKRRAKVHDVKVRSRLTSAQRHHSTFNLRNDLHQDKSLDKRKRQRKRPRSRPCKLSFQVPDRSTTRTSRPLPTPGGTSSCPVPVHVDHRGGRSVVGSDSICIN